MEMERINENTIRVLIGNDDLNERGITVLDLLGSHQQIESFFYSILEEVDTEHQFQDNDSVTFQVLPNRNGLELFISKNNFVNDSDDESDEANDSKQDEVSDFLKRQLGQTDQNTSDRRRTAVDNNDVEKVIADNQVQTSRVVIDLGDFENMIQVARLLRLENASSNLYRYHERYYLEITFFVEETSDETIKDELSIAYEYGKKSTVTADVLAEHAELVMESTALELTRYYFVK
ncbi:adaptor protein MecA [Paucilactobacillus sp. N302-9]